MEIIERATLSQNLKYAVRTTRSFGDLSYLEREAVEEFLEGVVTILHDPRNELNYLHLETLAKEYKNAISHQDL